MKLKISSLEDVKTFGKQLIAEGVSFHPDDDFTEYVNFKTGLPCYSLQRAAVRNKLMDKCFEVCSKENTDIYEIMLQVTLQETGLHKFIPMPSLSNDTQLDT